MVHPRSKAGDSPKHTGRREWRQTAVAELGEINAYKSKFYSVRSNFY